MKNLVREALGVRRYITASVGIIWALIEPDQAQSILWCQIVRQRRFLAHQSNCYASVRRHIRIVRKQRIRFGLARHHEDIARRDSLRLQNLTYGIGAIGGQFPGTIARLW